MNAKDVALIHDLAQGLADFVAPISTVEDRFFNWAEAQQYCLTNPDKDLQTYILDFYKIDLGLLRSCNHDAKAASLRNATTLNSPRVSDQKRKDIMPPQIGPNTTTTNKKKNIKAGSLNDT